MSDSQRFPVAAHVLAYLAHKDAFSASEAGSSACLAASVPTNPVVVRRVTAMLPPAAPTGAPSGPGAGAWLLRQPDKISLETVLRAVNGCAHFGAPPAGAKGCPVGEAMPRAIAGAIKQADAAPADRLAKITVADLLNSASAPDVAA